MENSRYQLVDSLYGPGTVGAWFLTLGAVLISWTLNKSSRCKDTITIDFLAALLLPMVSAGHLMLQVARLPFSVAETITAKDVEVQKYSSAMEAPLTICETFLIAALLLAICCGPWWNSVPKLKRLGMVVVVGLLSWATENVMFLMATMRGVKLKDATLSRPYFFLLTPIVASVWTFLVVCLAWAGSVWTISKLLAQKTAHNIKRDPERTSIQRPLNPPRVSKTRAKSTEITARSVERLNAELEALEQARRAVKDAEASVHQGRALFPLTLLSMIFLPINFVTSIYRVRFETEDSTKTASSHAYLIPKSNGSISNLDQILALIGGCLVLLNAIREAYRSRLNIGNDASRMIQRRKSF